MNALTNLTTVTELQRNFKKVSERAKSLNDALIVLANSNPHGVYVDYQTFLDKYEEKTKINFKKKRKSIKEKTGVDAVFGMWSKEEADQFDKVIEETCEQIDPEDWE